MPFDQAPPLEVARRPDWELPEITAVQAKATEYRPRAPRNFAHPLPAVTDAVEIVVTVAAPLPIRAMAPVLYVGDVPLTESQPVDRDGRQIRFWGFERARLRTGAPITLGWSGEPRPKGKKRTKFKFALPSHSRIARS